jgi:hypothetical protein
MFRPQGPHPVIDAFGMMTVVALLDHSLNTRVNETRVQFNTIQKMDQPFQTTRGLRPRKIGIPRLRDIGREREWASPTLYCRCCGSPGLQEYTMPYHDWKRHLDDRTMCIELLIEIQLESEGGLEWSNHSKTCVMYPWMECFWCVISVDHWNITSDAVRCCYQVKQPDYPALHHMCLAMRG